MARIAYNRVSKDNSSFQNSEASAGAQDPPSLRLVSLIWPAIVSYSFWEPSWDVQCRIVTRQGFYPKSQARLRRPSQSLATRRVQVWIPSSSGRGGLCQGHRCRLDVLHRPRGARRSAWSMLGLCFKRCSRLCYRLNCEAGFHKTCGILTQMSPR